jgi:hypothetical protein
VHRGCLFSLRGNIAGCLIQKLWNNFEPVSVLPCALGIIKATKCFSPPPSIFTFLVVTVLSGKADSSQVSGHDLEQEMPIRLAGEHRASESGLFSSRILTGPRFQNLLGSLHLFLITIHLGWVWGMTCLHSPHIAECGC